MHVLHVLPSVMCESGRFQSLLVSRRYSTEMVYMKKLLMPKRLPRLVVDHSFLLQSQFARQTFELFVSKRGWWCYFIRKNFRRWKFLRHLSRFILSSVTVSTFSQVYCNNVYFALPKQTNQAGRSLSNAMRRDITYRL